MVLVFILELSAGISGYALRGSATEVITEKMRDTMGKYNQNNEAEIKLVWDNLQQDVTLFLFSKF